MLFSSILILIVAKALPLIRISSIHFTRITAIILLLSGILSFNILYIQSIGNGIGIYSGLFQITNISITIELFLLIIGFFIITGMPNIFNPVIPGNLGNNISNKEIDYSIIVLFSTLGSSLLVSSFDLISLYLSIELQSFGLYILTTLYRNSNIHGIGATNAGLKYFLLGGLSSAIILLGTGIIYSYTGMTQLESIYTLISSSNIDYVIIGTILGLILIIIGLLFKIAAAPLHNWAPDVYDETPTIVTIWLTIMPKISILVLLLELISPISSLATVTLASNAGTSIFPGFWLASLASLGDSSNILNNLSSYPGQYFILLKNILLISSIASLIIGTVVGLAQIKIKRLLAYSTISHIGFMLLALAINTEQSIDSFLFYLLQYIFTNLNIFLILLGISYININNNNNLLAGEAWPSPKGEIIDIKYIKDLQGLFFNNPILSLSFSISLFSMAGIPPLIGFFSKQFVLNSALDQGYYFMSILAILVSVISASYYLKIIKIIHTGETKTLILPGVDNGNEEIAYNNNNNITSTHSFIISSISLFILLFIFNPTLILSSTQVLSLTLFVV
jgi:NADH-ubiquinone oxidoreductase chain 2